MHGQLHKFSCRDERGRLHPVPPMTTRTELYCTECPFFKDGRRLMGCLFLPSWTTDFTLQSCGRTEAQRQWHAKRAAEMRLEHKNASGDPLGETCWNCRFIRRQVTQFVCGEEECPRPRSAASMQQHKACELFQWRTEMEILPFARQVESPTTVPACL